MGLALLAPPRPKPREGKRSAELERPGLLSSRNGGSYLEGSLDFRLLRTIPLEQQLAFEPVQLGLIEPLTAFVHSSQRLIQYGKALPPPGSPYRKPQLAGRESTAATAPRRSLVGR